MFGDDAFSFPDIVSSSPGIKEIGGGVRDTINHAVGSVGISLRVEVV